MRQRENRGIIGNYQAVTSVNASGIHSLVDAQQNRGNSSWPIAGIPNLVDILLVGGGAGGGIPGDGGSGGAGGGGGYVYYQQNVNFGAGVWTISVGAGGTPVAGYSNNGSPSTLSGQGNTYTAGGGQRNQSSPGPQTGGLSGQTINGSTTNYTGGASAYPGDCYSRGGGGGAGSAGNGGSASSGTGGNGGPGYSSNMSGSSINYGGGGGAGAESTGGSGGAGGGGNGEGGTSNNSTAGTANTGGGGGGAGGRCNVAGGVNGKSGGSGIVIIRYLNTFNNAASTTGSPTLTNVGGYKIYTFTGNGSLTFS